MPVSVRILNRSGNRPALYASRDFDQLPVSIGRDSTCSVVLDDPNRRISRFHVEIEEQDGVHWMSVVSKVNPVMVGGRRYGPGTRLTLKNGDVFEIGEYESQWKDKNSDYESAKKDAESEDKKANEREQKYKEMVAQHQKLRG